MKMGQNGTTLAQPMTHTSTLGRVGKRKKKEKGKKEERKWRQNWSLDGGVEMVVERGK